MMDKEMMQRIKTAAGYQKQAVRALFPEEMSSHLDVIEGEMKAMLMEAAMELMAEYRSTGTANTDAEKKSTAKKVDIS